MRYPIVREIFLYGLVTSKDQPYSNFIELKRLLFGIATFNMNRE